MRRRRHSRNPLLMTVGRLAVGNPSRAVVAWKSAKERLEDWLRDFVRRSRPGTVHEALRLRQYVTGTIQRKGLDARRVWGNPRGWAARELEQAARVEAYEASERYYLRPREQVRRALVAKSGRKPLGYDRSTIAKVRSALAKETRSFTPSEVRRSLPNRGARKNPSASGLVRTYEVPLSEVKKVTGYAAAEQGFRRFHGGEPTKALVAEYDDGRSGVREEVLYAIGPAQIELDEVEGADGRPVRIKRLKVGTVYSVPQGWKSSKAGKQWIHSHEEGGGRPPIHAVDPVTGIMQQLAGTYYVDEWIER